MYSRRPGGCIILPAPHLGRSNVHPSRCALTAPAARSNGESSTSTERPVEPDGSNSAGSRMSIGWLSPLQSGMRCGASAALRSRSAHAHTHAVDRRRDVHTRTTADRARAMLLLLSLLLPAPLLCLPAPWRTPTSRASSEQQGARTPACPRALSGVAPRLGRTHMHTTADRPHAPMPARWLPRGIFARAARTALADGTSCGGKRANGSRARQAARQQQCAGGRRRGASRNCTIGGDARVVRGVGRAGALRFESEPAANERIAPSAAANGQMVRARGGLRGSSSAAVGARGACARASERERRAGDARASPGSDFAVRASFCGKRAGGGLGWAGRARVRGEAGSGGRIPPSVTIGHPKGGGEGKARSEGRKRAREGAQPVQMVRGAGGGVAGQQRARPTRDARAPLPSKAGPRRQRRGREGQRRGCGVRTTAGCVFGCLRSCTPTWLNSIHSVPAVSTTDKSRGSNSCRAPPPAHSGLRLSSVINSEIETLTNNICGCRR